jgi:NAD(P)-dependent dehydrogenase (short-subunit alcohol dehydrogenase family)
MAAAENIFISADMSKPNEVEALSAKAVKTYDLIDCAFNNAATEGNMKLTTDFTESEFDNIISINLKGVWLCLKHELQQMLRQEPACGAIINTSSQLDELCSPATIATIAIAESRFFGFVIGGSLHAALAAN